MTLPAPRDRRLALLRAAVGFALLEPPRARELRTLHAWLSSWRGVGAIVTGMARQGHDLQLTEYAGEGWRATFYTTGLAHSIVTGSAWEPTPWGAVQRAAWGALHDPRAA